VIAIIAALPREIAGLVRGVRPQEALLRRGIHLCKVPGAIVVAAGMGGGRAALAVEAALAMGQIQMLVSAGLAGSCMAALKPGAVVAADPVIDVRTGERFSFMDRGESYVLTTTESIASVHEKARLAQTYDAAIVDMEAATVARLAVAHKLEFRAIKGISDAHDFELASLGRFAGKHGHFRTGAFALHTAVRPHHWPKAVTLGRNSNRALATLHERLRVLIDAAKVS
jgi:adenosylhomocysteine nucleosidase